MLTSNRVELGLCQVFSLHCICSLNGNRTLFLMIDSINPVLFLIEGYAALQDRDTIPYSYD